MKILLLTLFLLPVMSSCQPKEKDSPEDQLFIDYSALQHKQHRLLLVASRQQGDIRGAHLRSGKKLQIPEVRTMFVESLDEFLEMQEDPLLTNIEFSICFADRQGEFMSPPSIAYAYLKDDKIVYCYYDQTFGKFSGYEDVEETYDQAKAMVKQ